jgi:hypothetical protein
VDISDLTVGMLVDHVGDGASAESDPQFAASDFDPIGRDWEAGARVPVASGVAAAGEEARRLPLLSGDAELVAPRMQERFSLANPSESSTSQHFLHTIF